MTRIAARPPTPASSPVDVTVADLLRRLGGIPPHRVRMSPAPGTADERDVLELLDRENRACELVDGTLVEKAMGFEEAHLAGLLLTHLNHYLLGTSNLGIAVGPDGILRLTTGLLRIPDLSFVSWDRLPGRAFPKEPVPRLPLDLAVEILSRSNSKAEIDRKVREYLDAGTRLVWLIDPRKRTARVHEGPGRPRILRDGDTLEGGDVLPGFALPLKTLFDQASRGPGA